MDIDEFAHLLNDGEVQVVEVFVVLSEEGADVVLIKLKERALAISRLQGVPMDASPRAVIAYTYILYQSASTMFNGYGERLQAVGCGDDTAITPGLLDKRLAGLKQYVICTIQLAVPLNRAKVSGG